MIISIFTSFIKKTVKYLLGYKYLWEEKESNCQAPIYPYTTLVVASKNWESSSHRILGCPVDRLTRYLLKI